MRIVWIVDNCWNCNDRITNIRYRLDTGQDGMAMTANTLYLFLAFFSVYMIGYIVGRLGKDARSLF
jgi:hypothetical protein